MGDLLGVADGLAVGVVLKLSVGGGCHGRFTRDCRWSPVGVALGLSVGVDVVGVSVVGVDVVGV